MSVVKNPCKVYIGNIPRDADEAQIEKMFDEVGKCLSFEFKGDFAFAEYFDSTGSEEAIRKYDGVRIRGRRLIVEPFRYRGGDPRYRRAPPKNINRGQYRCIITNLSANTTAQDLRDWVEHEKLNSVAVTDVYNRHGLNEGVVEFRDKGDWDYCISKLDQVKLDGCYVRVYDEKEYNRRKLKAYDRPRGPFRRSRSGSGARDNFKRHGAGPNDMRDDRRYNGDRGGGMRGNHGPRGGGFGGGRRGSPPNRGFDDHRGRDRDRGRERERFRSQSPENRDRGNRDRRNDRDDRNNYGGYNNNNNMDRGDRGGRGNGSRSRSRSRGRNNYNHDNNNRDNGRNRRGYDNQQRSDRYDRYDRR